MINRGYYYIHFLTEPRRNKHPPSSYYFIFQRRSVSTHVFTILLLFYGVVDTTLFIKCRESHILLVQVYVDNIIFGSTNEDMYREFSNVMQGEFDMSLMGELNYLLGLYIKLMEN